MALSCPCSLARSFGTARTSAGAVDSADWHLAQALLRQCGGATAAAVMLDAVPMLAGLLDPKRDVMLRLTALSLLEHLLADATFAASNDLSDWAEHIYEAMLLPNLVWRAGKPSEQIRLAAYRCLSRLTPLDKLAAAALASRQQTALPLYVSGLDDDHVDTRRLACAVLATHARRVGRARPPQRRRAPTLSRAHQAARRRERRRAARGVRSHCRAARRD